MATRYPDAPRPDVIDAGNSFEDFVCDKLSEMGITLRTYKSKEMQFSAGENKIGFEIKLDAGHTKYKHLSIEVAEKTRDDPALQWTRSGILRNDNSWLYIQGNKEMFFILFKPALLEYYKKNKPDIKDKFCTIRTFYLEYADAEKLGICVRC
jgi:hypothetical protein